MIRNGLMGIAAVRTMVNAGSSSRSSIGSRGPSSCSGLTVSTVGVHPNAGRCLANSRGRCAPAELDGGNSGATRTTFRWPLTITCQQDANAEDAIRPGGETGHEIDKSPLFHLPIEACSTNLNASARDAREDAWLGAQAR